MNHVFAPVNAGELPNLLDLAEAREAAISTALGQGSAADLSICADEDPKILSLCADEDPQIMSVCADEIPGRISSPCADEDRQMSSLCGDEGPLQAPPSDLSLCADETSPSDSRLKTDIEQVGTTVYGLPLFNFRYKDGSDRFQGVMAQDVLQVMPDAVSVGSNGFYQVNYGRLGISMTRA